jgi:ribonuclease VapC
MVIDTSAVVAILFGELDAPAYAAAIEVAAVRQMSAVTRVELGLVVEGRKGEPGRALLETFLEIADVEVTAATGRHAELALDAWRRFGKGRHAAGLNIGDCFAYALARVSGEPLLYKGDDFARTDVQAALDRP